MNPSLVSLCHAKQLILSSSEMFLVHFQHQLYNIDILNNPKRIDKIHKNKTRFINN